MEIVLLIEHCRQLSVLQAKLHPGKTGTELNTMCDTQKYRGAGAEQTCLSAVADEGEAPKVPGE